MNISALIRPNVRRLRPYEAYTRGLVAPISRGIVAPCGVAVPPRGIVAPCRVKLDANESPYSLPVPAEVLRKIPTNRYPDPEATALKKALSKQFGAPASCILIGNGSDELIYYLITVFGGPVLYPTPTFSMYGIIAKALGQETIEIPLDGRFDLDIKKMLPLVKGKKGSVTLTFLSSPNNPTGNCFSAEGILKIIESSRGIVVLDEAYQPFSSQRGFLPLLKDYKNLLILRTLSKIGLAGLRVGFLIGDEALIREVNKVRLPFNVNSFSQAIAVATLKEKVRLRSYIKAIVTERERLYKELKKNKGVAPYPSEANFILFKVKHSDKVYIGLLKKGVLVRNMKGLIDPYLRVTVGTKRENDIFLKALKEVSI